jgi:dsDNA-specific endonuclease/ATPase MutS2
LRLHLSFLSEALRRAEERANDLEEKIRASEEAREKAQVDAAGVADLRQRVQAVEDALSDKEAKFIQRDNDIITRLETQSQKFASTIFSFVLLFFLVLTLSLVLTKSCFFPSRENG